MIRSLWIAKTGLDAQQTQLDAITHNLANVSTNGYKRVRATFEDLLYQTQRPAGAPTSQSTSAPTALQVGTGVRPVATLRNFAQGNLQQTGNALDMSVNGEGFFQVQMPDGTTGYTRDGSFQMDAQGQVVTSNGFPMSPAINIPANATKITIAADGSVNVQVAGSATTQTVGQIQLATFPNVGGLNSLGQNLYGETSASGAPSTATPGTNGAGVLQQGYVETSNVNVVEELVNMIQAQRAFEMNSKAVQTSDQMLQRLSQL